MRTIIATTLLLICVVSTSARAEIYKCTEADGTLTYSQTPCSREKPVTIPTAVPSGDTVDCSYAGKFAISTARLMRNGMGSDEVFNRYGGLEALSRGSIGVINYVYAFRTNSGVTAERISGLTSAKCKAKGFGDVSCEALPLSFTDQLGGCDAEEGAEIVPPPSNVVPDMTPDDQRSPVTTNTRAQNQYAAADREADLTEQCKKRYRDQIDAIDAQMRSGYSSQQGEKYREQLRELTGKLRSC